MFCKISRSSYNKNPNKNNEIISLFDDIIIPLSTLCILISTCFTTTIVGIIIKQEDEKSNVLILLPLILLVILNVFHLELNVIRMSIMCLAIGYVIYDLMVIYNSQYFITNIIYLSISLIQLICGIICLF